MEQAEPAVVTTLEPFSSKHREAVRLFKVRSLVIVTAPLNREVPKTPKVVEAMVPTPTELSLAFTTRVLFAVSAIKPVFRVVVAVAESGIWKMAVPVSSRTLKIFPVKAVALRTNLMKSPEVKLEDEAVRKLPLVTVEEAVIWPAFVTEKRVTEASATEKVLVTRKVLSIVLERVTKIPAVVEVGV